MIVFDPESPSNLQSDNLRTGSRTGSASGDMLAEQGDQAENELGQRGERGEQYKQQTRRQRFMTQRMRELSEKDRAKENSRVRRPRNERFKNQKEDQPTRFGRSDVIVMSVVALMFDGVGGIISLLDFIIPPTGEFINSVTVFPLATLTLYTMYKHRGVEFKDTKVLVRFWGSLLIGFIPIVAILPEYFLNVILVSTVMKAEEKIKNL